MGLRQNKTESERQIDCLLPSRQRMFVYLSEELRATLFRHGAEWEQHTDIPRLLLDGKLRTMQSSRCECTQRTKTDSLGREVKV